MKKYALLLILSVIVSSDVIAQKKKIWENNEKRGLNNLVITHPTVSNLKAIKNLLAHGLINMVDYRIIGVYHKKERYDYEHSLNYIDTAFVPQVEMFLHEVSDTISQDMLYRQNLLSGHFHRIHFKSTRYFNELNSENSTPSVYRNHHQAVKDIGKGFKVIAASMDGKIAEVLQHGQYRNVAGVQFHPEAAFLYDAGQNFRLTADDTVSFTGPQILHETRSMEFHRKFWKNFQKRLNE